MTVQQQAYQLIDQLPEECVEAVLPREKKTAVFGITVTEKMAAYNEMQEL